MDIHTVKDLVTNDETDKSRPLVMVLSLEWWDAAAAVSALRTPGSGLLDEPLGTSALSCLGT